ncbi:Wadjet anti-phage system protein JetD domain-containing protein [Paraburkholderia sp. GAS82]|uniref:Wadjet anti-phage system protein JetD domain-containing protein n=1 Tax=Paraburkholderia sp. GAS82 TaxID=3035137 RepID=UPI003D1ED93A
MDTLATPLLTKLLHDGEKIVAGRRIRAASLTGTALREYAQSRSVHERDAFEATIRAAADAGAVSFDLEKGAGADRSIIRVTLRDVDRLADFLGRATRLSQVELARDVLEPLLGLYPVLDSVLERWRALRKVRGCGPESPKDWLDATEVLAHLAQTGEVNRTELPVREVSVKLFKNSKRIERLTIPLDVLLSGSIDAIPRQAAEVWYEIGLRREEQPARLAGAVRVRRSRVSGVLDEPYVAFSPSTVMGLNSTPDSVLTIENLTTFHTEASRRCNESVLLVYTAGMPSPAWRAMYERLLCDVPVGVPVMHWGDVDEGGFRIASNIAAVALRAGHQLLPFRMSPQDVPELLRREATEREVDRMSYFAQKAGWPDLATALVDAKFTVEQEALS